MNALLIICLVIFVLTLVSYLLNKVPMWVTAMISLAALYFTGCIDAAGALGGFANVNTTLMAAMFIVAAGFRRTSLVDAMVNGIMKVTRGSFKLAYLGYLIIAVLLTNFISSPMVVYSIVSTLLCAYLDKNGYSRSKYIFPMMVVCVSCCGILPLATAIQQAGQNTGFLETYGFDITYEAIYPFMAGWPMLIIVPLWALFIGPKFLPETAPLPIAAKEEAKQKQKALSPLQDKIGIVLFFATIVLLIFSGQLGLETWAVALVGSLLMVVFGVADQKTVLRDVPWDMILLYVGALALGTALTNTGAGEFVGNKLAAMVGGTTNSYVLGFVFFVIPFIITQFMLNRAVSAVFMPICLLTCQALGANPIGLMFLVGAGSLTAFMTPMATPAVPLAMADGGYDLKTIVKGAWTISIIIPLIYIPYVMTIFPAF